MPTGKGRRQPPLGFLTSKQAGDLIGINRLYKFINSDPPRLHKHIPTGYKHGYYSQKEVQAILDAEATFFQASHEGTLKDEDAMFAVATPSDLEALYTMAVKLFPKTATAEHRRKWMRKEPRGYYIMKTDVGRVVAYFYLLSLRPDRLPDYLHGQMPSSKITPDDIEPMRPGQEVSACALAGIGTDPDVPEEKRKKYAALLLRGVRKELARFGHEGIIIPHFYAFSETVNGIAMCLKMGMRQWEPPKGERCTFVLDTQTSTAPLLRDYKQALAQWQASYHLQPVSTPAAPTTRTRAGPGADKKRRQASTTTQEHATRPPDTITLQELADELGINRTTLLGHVLKEGNLLEHIAIPRPGREHLGERERYFTAEQAQTVRDWHQTHSKKKRG